MSKVETPNTPNVPIMSEDMFVLKQEQILRNFLLGTYDEKGNYEIDKDIISDLVTFDKMYVDKFENVHLCKSVIKADKCFNFSVVFDDKGATLNLLEKVKYCVDPTVDTSNIITTKLDFFAIEQASEHVKEVYEHFHISDQPSDKYKDLSDLTDEEIALILHLYNKIKKDIYTRRYMLFVKDADYDKIELEYLNSVLDILYDSRALGLSVLNDFEKELVIQKESINKNTPLIALSLNDILNKCLQKNVLKKTGDEADALNHRLSNCRRAYLESKMALLDEEIPLDVLNKSYAEIKYMYLMKRQELKAKKRLDNVKMSERFIATLTRHGVSLSMPKAEAPAPIMSKISASKASKKAKGKDKPKKKAKAKAKAKSAGKVVKKKSWFAKKYEKYGIITTSPGHAKVTTDSTTSLFSTLGAKHSNTKSDTGATMEGLTVLLNRARMNKMKELTPDVNDKYEHVHQSADTHTIVEEHNDVHSSNILDKLSKSTDVIADDIRMSPAIDHDTFANVSVEYTHSTEYTDM